MPKNRTIYQRELRTFGVGNITFANGKKYCLQFFDFDGEITKEAIKQIRKIFPYDCIIFQSKNGYHFLSFTLLDKNPKKIKRNAFKLSKKLDQDYTTPKNKMKNLVLRIGPKFKNRKEVSERPSYLQVLNFPHPDSKIAKKHLEYYYFFMKLPSYIYEFYKNNCVFVDNSFNIVYYQTGPIIEEVI